MTLPKPRDGRQRWRTSERITTEHGLDLPNAYVEFQAFWELTPGCAQSWESPAEPPEAELLCVHITQVETDFMKVERLPQLCTYLTILLDTYEPMVTEIVENDEDNIYHQAAFEAAHDRDEGLKDAAADAEYERRRIED